MNVDLLVNKLNLEPHPEGGYFKEVYRSSEIDENGVLKYTAIGNNLLEGETFQYTVKANTWFGSRVKSGGKFSLVGCTVAPGFDFNDFELGKKEDLLKLFPQHQKVIVEMTRI